MSIRVLFLLSAAKLAQMVWDSIFPICLNVLGCSISRWYSSPSRAPALYLLRLNSTFGVGFVGSAHAGYLLARRKTVKWYDGVDWSAEIDSSGCEVGSDEDVVVTLPEIEESQHSLLGGKACINLSKFDVIRCEYIFDDSKRIFLAKYYNSFSRSESIKQVLSRDQLQQRFRLRLHDLLFCLARNPQISESELSHQATLSEVISELVLFQRWHMEFFKVVAFWSCQDVFQLLFTSEVFEHGYTFVGVCYQILTLEDWVYFI